VSHYVYLLIDPRDNKAFYVGKGKGNRILAHEIEAKSGKVSAKCSRIREIWDAGLQVRRQFDSEHETDTLARRRETELIKSTAGLLNIADNDARPVMIHFTDAMFAFAFSRGLERAKAAYRWITHFHYDRMSSDFERRTWMRARDCVMAHTTELKQLADMGRL
jgi:hypothetical protein